MVDGTLGASRMRSPKLPAMGLRSWWKKEMKQADSKRLEQEEEKLRDPSYGEDPEESKLDAVTERRSGETMKDVERLGDFE
jgi:hypothetical protein